MKPPCNNCGNIRHGDTIKVREVLKGTACSDCGKLMYELDWQSVPLWVKIKRYLTLPRT